MPENSDVIKIIELLESISSKMDQLLEEKIFNKTVSSDASFKFSNAHSFKSWEN